MIETVRNTHGPHALETVVWRSKADLWTGLAFIYLLPVPVPVPVPAPAPVLTLIFG